MEQLGKPVKFDSTLRFSLDDMDSERLITLLSYRLSAWGLYDKIYQFWNFLFLRRKLSPFSTMEFIDWIYQKMHIKSVSGSVSQKMCFFGDDTFRRCIWGTCGEMCIVGTHKAPRQHFFWCEWSEWVTWYLQNAKFQNGFQFLPISILVSMTS